MKVGWYFHRLRAMTVSELAHRVMERWKHRSDAAFADSVRGIELGAATEGVVALPERDAAPESLKQTLARDAASLMRGDWKLFGWREVNVGTPPRWHQDVTCGVDIASDALAHRVNHRALPGCADVRTIWEINRWSEMVRLAMHGWLNDDREAVRVAVGWLEDWCDKNPAGYGINWTSPLEVGLRLINFVWFDELVSQESRVKGQGDGGDAQRLRRLSERIVPAHTAWVWRYRSFGSSANNHLLGELVGLLHAVKRWPALETVMCPAERLWREISRCVLEQFAEDGGNKEQALHYHLFAWEMAWHAARLMRVTDGPVMERLRRAAEFFVHMAHDAEQWEYGDNDDAQIVPVTLEREHAVAEWRAWMRGEVKGEALGYWFAADDGSACAAPAGIEASSERSPRALPWAGMSQAGGLRSREAGVRSGMSRGQEPGWWHAGESGMAVFSGKGWKLRLDASPLGFGKLAAHGHADALHLSIWDGSHALVIDPGTGGYFGAKELRAKLAAWEAHNGPQPAAGFRTPKRVGTFLWMGDHRWPILCGSETDSCGRFRHEDHGLARSVQTDDEDELHVLDMHHEGGALRTRWHFAPECEVTLAEDEAGKVFIQRGERRWAVRFSSEVMAPTLALEDGVASRAYGKVELCAVLAVTGTAAIRSEWRRAEAVRV